VTDGSDLHVIVLAAGASTRFGSPKQLVRLHGRPLLHTAVARSVEVAGHAVIVVLGAHAATLAPLLRHSPATLTVNRQWREGIASSIRTGVAMLPGNCEAVMLVLADQPAVSAADLRQLVTAWRRQPLYMIAAQYAGTVGVPAIFPRSSFSDLSSLRGDRGAQSLLRANPDRVVRVPLESAAVDIDRPEDLLDFDPG
jgi:molybdenum cofactor cytidylyltransferase